MGIIINENVAENFINGPIGAKGSKGIRIIDPIPQHNTPAKGPNIKKHVTQTIDTSEILFLLTSACSFIINSNSYY